MVTQETASAFGTERSRTSIASTMQCNQFKVWVSLSDHFTSCTQQEPHETPAPSNVAKWQLLQNTLKKPTYLILIKPTKKKRKIYTSQYLQYTSFIFSTLRDRSA